MALGDKLSPLSVGADNYKFNEYNKSERQCQLIQCEMGFSNIQKKECQQKWSKGYLIGNIIKQTMSVKPLQYQLEIF